MRKDPPNVLKQFRRFSSLEVHRTAFSASATTSGECAVKRGNSNGKPLARKARERSTWRGLPVLAGVLMLDADDELAGGAVVLHVVVGLRDLF